MFLATESILCHYEGMDNRATNVWLGRIKVLRAWAAKSREIGQRAEVGGNERRRLLTGLKGVWQRKREEWLSHRGRREDDRC
jgi:hypothetical protein